MSLRLSSLGALLGFVAACSAVGPAAEPEPASMTETTVPSEEDWLAMPGVARREPVPAQLQGSSLASVSLTVEDEPEVAATLPAITGDGKFILTSSALIDVERDVTIKRFEDPEAVEAWHQKDLSWQALDHIAPTSGASSGDGAYEMVSTVGNLLIGFAEPTLRFGDATSREVLSSKQVVWWMASPTPFPGNREFFCPRAIGVMSDAYITKDRRILLAQIDYMQPSCVCGSGGDGVHVTKLSAANVALAKASGPPSAPL